LKSTIHTSSFNLKSEINNLKCLMTERRQCEFFLLRYVPDAVKDEFVNLGVVLLESAAPTGAKSESVETSAGGRSGLAFADVRFTRDWRRVRCLDPDVDVEMLEALEREIRERLAEDAASREWLLGKMQDSFSNCIRLTPAKAVLAESPQAELESLAALYLERSRRTARSAGGRQVVFAAMREQFERQGVWRFMRKNIAAAEYTHRGDPLKIDCAYGVPSKPKIGLAGVPAPQRNGNGARVRLFHAVSLLAEVNAAKLLAFSFPQVRAGIRRAEEAEAHLTAVVEDDLDRRDDAIAFALATLEAQEIAVASVAQMPALAERARVELRL
jgi:hypothetical protein